MSTYMSKMVEDFEKKYVLSDKAATPATTDLFGNDESSPKLDKELREDFHTFTAKGLFACKRARRHRNSNRRVNDTCAKSISR